MERFQCLRIVGLIGWLTILAACDEFRRSPVPIIDPGKYETPLTDGVYQVFVTDKGKSVPFVNDMAIQKDGNGGYQFRALGSSRTTLDPAQMDSAWSSGGGKDLLRGAVTIGMLLWFTGFSPNKVGPCGTRVDVCTAAQRSLLWKNRGFALTSAGGGYYFFQTPLTFRVSDWPSGSVGKALPDWNLFVARASRDELTILSAEKACSMSSSDLFGTHRRFNDTTKQYDDVLNVADFTNDAAVNARILTRAVQDHADLLRGGLAFVRTRSK